MDSVKWAKTMMERQNAGLCRYCGKKREGQSTQYCNEHHQKLLAQKRARYRKSIANGVCSWGKCGRKHYSSGLCKRHYLYAQTACKKWRKLQAKKKVPQ